MAWSDRKINIVIVAGELSGDILGANLIYAINYGFAKDVMNGGYVPPFTFILFRGIGATFLFWIPSLFLRS